MRNIAVILPVHNDEFMDIATLRIQRNVSQDIRYAEPLSVRMPGCSGRENLLLYLYMSKI